MLPRSLRMLTSTDFRTTIRHGRRIGGKTMVMHTYRPSGVQADAGRSVAPVARAPQLAKPSVQVGFVVSKAVGNAVVRNRVKRRLRHLVAAALSSPPDVPRGTSIVIRALPASALRPDLLVGDFERAWRRSCRPGAAPDGRSA